ncbi:hypothetical protein [Methylophilus sp.]|uniref:hypothetical protein n=1 Tax=Methylophilus sp. TaxID=29541 RepID=UPI000D437C41|nr:hypothetical protein [Methylophilus sp.]PPD12510.1 MAG: hypothetical protein CTY26_04510 [Methylophilus sp.]
MATESKDLIEEIIDNAMTPAKDIGIEPNEQTETRAQAGRKSPSPNSADKRLRASRLGRK